MSILFPWPPSIPKWGWRGTGPSHTLDTQVEVPAWPRVLLPRLCITTGRKHVWITAHRALGSLGQHRTEGMTPSTTTSAGGGVPSWVDATCAWFSEIWYLKYISSLPTFFIFLTGKLYRKFTILVIVKCTYHSVALITFTVLCCPHQHPSPGLFHLPKLTLSPLNTSFPFPPTPCTNHSTLSL